MYDVAIIGCGIVGAAAAFELSRYELSVVILERGNDVATGSTKANSAIIHAGFDPFPGTLMARLNVEGARLAAELCRDLDVPHKRCGSLVLAFDDAEMAELERLKRKAVDNGVPGVGILSKSEVLGMEPGLNGDVVAALHAPSAMIVDPWEYTLALAETAVRNGTNLMLECTVTGIDCVTGGYALHTGSGVVNARTAINAAGIYADTIHDMVSKPSFTIRPAKGEYCLLDKKEGGRVGSVIFQCPTEVGKGVLVTPTIHGNLCIGPSSINTEDRDDVSTTPEGLEFVMNTALKSVPGIDTSSVIRSFCGNRARSDRTDFIIEEARPGFIDLAGIKSPGLSAAPAIARLAVDMLSRGGLGLVKKSVHISERKRVRFRHMSLDKKKALISGDPMYGRVICRCETITEGEIRDALDAPIPPRSIDAVKRRCGSGMGRCQGGFCSPRVLEILARHYGRDPSEVLQDGAGTYVLTGETKSRRPQPR